MAAADLRDKLSCSICQEIYTDPVTLPCGHTFCRVCIGKTWDWQEGMEEDLTCPECKHRYWGRPELNINVALSSLVQRLLPTVPEQHGPGIYCTEYHYPPVTAYSTCLLCKVSLCYDHIIGRSNCVEHELTAPTPSQRDRYCPKHPELLLEYYCPQDGVCICASCYRVGEHRGHRVEPLNEETSERKKVKLREVLVELSPKREEIKRQIQRLQERRREVAEKAAGETKGVTALFRDIRERLEALEKRLLRDISEEQERVSLQLLDLIEQLEIKKDELSRKIRHIEELCNMAAPLTVLQAREPDGAEFHGAEWGGRNRRKMEDINAPAVGNLDVGWISETLLTGLDQIVLGAKGRRFPGQEATDLVLDINTAGSRVSVSGDGKSASYSTAQHYPQSPERFQEPQALSTRSFPSGRHYWDVEGSESGGWRVGVAYPNIQRHGEGPQIGKNGESWCLVMYKDSYSVSHGWRLKDLPLKPSCSKIRVSLDYEAGRLSFYELSEPIRHIYTYIASFTEPLHAAFWVGWAYYPLQCGKKDYNEGIWMRIISKCSDSP